MRGGEVALCHPTLQVPPLYLIKKLTLTRGFSPSLPAFFVAWGGTLPLCHP
jgi:hypothetical protein